MEFNTENLNPIVEFTFPGQDSLDEGDQAVISMRACPVDIVRQIMKSATTKKVEFKQPSKRAAYQRFEVEKVDDDVIYAESWDYVIVDWKNVNDQNGQPLECNRENKLLLIGQSPMFSECVQSWRDILEESTKKEDAEKNA